ncbi:PREDICTED: uncharacterized protein LOC105557272 [Vollenhovia emeryi]|uniref:uncharacterized protein LOC105557272 n=1 Tax=Vollenhovia emeryi TaxID=411798 RepID=UPI0005F38D6F|nr:PREDICTED: uncharacterized protein LOC105557272 [Vollenhovia emeryi]
MFRQIAIHPDDWDLQRILWQERHSQPIAYQLTTVTYGLNCAPFLALRTIQQLVSDKGYRFPLTIVPMSKGRYVDDIFGGADTISEAKDIVRDVIQLCEAGGFPLQKWNSNCLELLPKSNNGSSSTVEIEPTHFKILGLIWKPNTDTFHFTAATSPITVFTKRTIASDIAKLYDPLGLIAPILIRAKILLQELWLLKVEWDEPLSPELEQRWTTFRKQLHQLDQLSIPRWLGIVRSNTSVELHGFSDASQLAMAAVIYAKVSGNDGKVSVQLICSKTKVAPIKKLTIPRLELTAALLLARLMVHTVNALDLPNVTTFCWSDSSVALTWITTQPSRWKDFVRNRVSSIQELQSNTSWRFVPGKENPADCASRGLRSDQLFQHDLWWKGPGWLSKSQTSWPSIVHKSPPDVDLEERPGHVLVAVARQPSYWDLLDKYSSFIKLSRITATCRRVVSCLRQVPHSSPLNYPLTPVEIDQSCLFWIRIVQQTWFSTEIDLISRGKQLPKSNPLIRLIPFLDKHNLLRVGGRLHNAQIDSKSKHPLILPRRSPLSVLIIDDAHKRMLHGAVHIEVTDYTTEAFIAAYKRFTGRRGVCATLQSDCGTNFVGADAVLKRQFELSSKKAGHLASLLANDGTEWRFNPPSAPHFGGKWEAAVKSTKFHLQRVLGDTSLTYEEMTTITVQIEAVLNSGPLCPLLTRWQLLRQKVDHFWSRWSSEFLQRHLAISKWHHPSTEIKVGSLVLITDERYPPGKWPLARVMQLHPGPDGLTRVVTLKTTATTYKRPINKLCILPTDPDALSSTDLPSKAGGNVKEASDFSNATI